MADKPPQPATPLDPAAERELSLTRSDRLAPRGPSTPGSPLDTPEVPPPPGASRVPSQAPGRPHRFPPGTVLAERYRIVHVLGRGGMGEVYQADDLMLGQTVALKLLPDAMGHHSVHSLFHEVRVARQISHPNVCRIYDASEAEGLYFLSMEYVDGEDLATFLRRVGRLLPERAVAIGREICRGLEAIHEKEVLHRDLKPANLMIDGDGRVRITDFGIAAATGTVRGRDILRGTPAYMAPEQRAGREVSVRSDLYALGLVLYELLTGERVADRHLPLEPPSRLADGLDADVERILLRCLEEDPARRPASAREVAAALGEGASPAWQPAVGRVIPQRPHWQLWRLLGKGGFGEVWLAGHKKTREQRVFKFCHDAARLSPLKREITLFRLLQEELGERDDIVRILDWNFDEAPYFIESEHTGGGNLLEWAEEQGGVDRVPLAARLEIVARVADALAAAHSVGVLHKDVKPSNVLVLRQPQPREAVRIRLVDFGIGLVLDEARLADAGITAMGLTEHTASTGSSGTPLYRAPELYEGKPATVQADVYSLGVMLYQLVVGDLRRALGPGWERDVADELLREDIAAVVDRSPQRRLADTGTLASRLRSLEARRVRRSKERRTREEAERNRLQLERAVRRRRLLTAVLGASLLVTAVVSYQARSIARQAARNRDVTLVAVAGDLLSRDPTRAARVLLEAERPDEVATAVSRMRQALQHKLALFELRHDEVLSSAAWSPSGERILTASEAGTVRLYRADGRGEPTVLEGCPGDLTSASWSPDGERLAATCWDGTVRVFRVAPAIAVFSPPNPPEGDVFSPPNPPEGDVFSPPNPPEGDVLSPPNSPDGDVDTPSVLLEGHTDTVRTAVWSPNGERLATTSNDHTVRVWDVAERTAIVLRGHTDKVTAAAWSPDGERLATVSFDSTARVWSLGEGDRGGSRPSEATHVFEHDDGKRVWSAVWSPGGDRLVTTSNDHTVRIWTAGSVKPILLAGHQSDVRVAAWSPDGEQVMTASRDRTVRTWSSSTGELLRTLEGHEGGLRAAVWSPDGKWILTAAQDATARVWRLPESASENLVEMIVLGGHDAYVGAAMWSPGGERILTMSRTTVRVWAAGTTLTERGSGEPQVLSHYGRRVWTAAWSPDGRHVVTASEDATARVWSVGTGDLGDRSGEEEGGSREESGREPIVLRGHGAPVRTAAWSPDGRRIVTASEDATARVWHAGGAGEPIVLEGHDGKLTSAAFDPTGAWIVTVSEDEAAQGVARVWRADGTAPSGGTGGSAGEPIVLRADGAPVTTALWSPDGTRVATIAAADVLVWRIAPVAFGSEEPLVLTGHREVVRTATWSLDGEGIVTTSFDGTARVWRLDQAGDLDEPVVLRHGPMTPVRSAAFSPSGDRVVTGLDNGRVLVWRADGSGRRIVFEGHRFAVTCALFSPDGQWILTTSVDDTAQVRRADGSGEPIVLEGHGDRVEMARWSPQGDRLVTASWDGTARVWRLATSDLIALLRAATEVCLDPVFREKTLGEPPAQAWRRYLECERTYGRSPPEAP